MSRNAFAPAMTTHQVALAIVLCLITAAPLAAQAPVWPDQRQVGPFLCHANFKLDAYEPLLADLGRLQNDLVEALGVAPTRETIHVYLFARKATYREYVEQYFPDVPMRRALFIKGRGQGMVFAYYSDEFQIDLRHECTHALLHAVLPVVPLWLDEGLAEYFEVGPERRAFDNPHREATVWNARLRMVAKIEKLEAIGQVSQMGAAEYRYAWAWVHFMLHGPPAAREQLQSYLATIAAHSPPGKLSRRLRYSVPDLDQRFAEHWRTWRPPARTAGR